MMHQSIPLLFSAGANALSPPLIWISLLLLFNLISFSLFGIDKWKARHHRWRIPEKTLFLSALLGGGAGALLGMLCFRHKTQHPQFVIGIPLILLVELIGGWWLYTTGVL